MKIKFLIILPLFFLVFLVAGSVASAATLSPVMIDSKLDPGQTAVYEMKLYNETEEDIFLSGYIEKFIPSGEHGEVQVLPPDVSDVSVAWIKLPNNSLFLKPGEGVSVPVIVEVPLTADVGGYYLAIMWETSADAKTDNNQTLIASRVGTLLLLTVKGEADNNLELIDFYLSDDKRTYSGLPVGFSTRLKNSGNVHQRPQGSIVIKNVFGQTTEIIPFNDPGSAILPNTTRIFDSTWGVARSGFFSTTIGQITNFNIGRFSAKAVIEYGNDLEITTEEVHFWIFPWQLVIVILIVIIILVGLGKIMKGKNKVKNKNKEII